jgi:hypothetical protein
MGGGAASDDHEDTKTALVRYLHLLAMAFFVGAQLFLVAAVAPSFRGVRRLAGLAQLVSATRICTGEAGQRQRGQEQAEVA